MDIKKTSMVDPDKMSGRKIFIHTLKIFLPIFLIILLISIFILKTQENLELKVFKNSEISIVDAKLKNIENEIKHVINDLLILKSSRYIDKFWSDIENEEYIGDLSNEMLNILAYNRTYDQGRIIDKDGMEIIRVNFNNGDPCLVPKEKLQNKKSRYYFRDAIILNKGEVFVSPLDLNMEDGQIEDPLKPMIRIATPVFDRKGDKRGVIVFNYLAQHILNQLDDSSNIMIHSKIMLVNSNGYCLKGPNQACEWGFMFNEKIDLTFDKLYPDTWAQIVNNEEAQFFTKDGMFTFKTIYPILESQRTNIPNWTELITSEMHMKSDDYYWKIVSFVSNKDMLANNGTRRNWLAFLVLVFSISLAFISWRLARAQYYRRQALSSLQVSNESKDKLFSIIAHDLKGPFNSLLGFSNILIKEVNEGDHSNIKKYSKVLNSNINKTYSFLINLLDWSTSQINRIDFVPEEFIFNELVDEVFQLLRLQAENKGISLKKNIERQIIISADRNMLSTVVRNLVSNAIKYSGKGEIELKAYFSDNDLYCSIKDNGIGIAKDRLDALFQFSEIESIPGTNNEKGTGLGLMLCKEFVEKHNGEIGVESDFGNGSVFWFRIPNYNTIS